MLTDGTNTTMLVSPNGGMGFGDGNGWWIILLILLFAGGFNGGFGNNIPFAMNTGAEVQSGFNQASVMSGIGDIQTGLNSISSQLCSGFAGVEQGANTRQMADMQTAFNAQNAMNAGFNGLQAQLSQCCCDNRLATNDLKYTIAQEACNTRQANTQNTQAILDKLCAIEIDTLKNQVEAKNDIIAQLRSQLDMATFNASQVAQTAQLISALKPTTTT